MRGRVLIIAGSDSGGGAGVQADIKTVTMLGGYAASAITAITVQDTLGVHGVQAISPHMIADQIRVVLRDIGADAIKTGMMGDVETIMAVAEVLREEACQIPLVLDPVMVAKGGASLLAPDAVACLKQHLLPLAYLVTPNAPELAALTGLPVETTGMMEKAARTLCAELLPHKMAVLAKGGHLDGAGLVDLLVQEETVTQFSASRIESRHTHGTGCTLASAIATGLAQGMDIKDAVRRAHAYVHKAIATAPGFGKGHGPLNHGHPLD